MILLILFFRKNKRQRDKELQKITFTRETEEKGAVLLLRRVRSDNTLRQCYDQLYYTLHIFALKPIVCMAKAVF